MRRPALLAAALLLASCSAPTPTIEGATEDTAIRRAAERALELGKAGALTPDGITVQVDVTDAYGNTTRADALRFKWTAEDLARISWSKMDDYAVLNLSQPEILTRNGSRALGPWCIDPEDQRGKILTPRMCGTPYESATIAFMQKGATHLSGTAN